MKKAINSGDGLQFYSWTSSARHAPYINLAARAYLARFSRLTMVQWGTTLSWDVLYYYSTYTLHFD